MRGDDGLLQRFVAATELYANAERELAVAHDEFALAAAVRSIAAASRELLGLAAIIGGTRPPKADEPPCLLDPSHGPATGVVVWAPPESDPRPVPLCTADAATASAGEQPEPRRLAVHGHLRPY